MLLDSNVSLPTNWTGQSFDLGGVIYTPVGFADIRQPPSREVTAAATTLRELSSLFCKEMCEMTAADNMEGSHRTDNEFTTSNSQAKTC